MTVDVRHRPWVWVAAVVAAVLAGLAALAMAGGGGRGALLAALQRPAAVPAPGASGAARATVRAAGGRAQVTVGGARYAVRLAPNRASVANALSIAVSTGGRPVTGATVTVSFSMPAMDMWRAFSVTLHPVGSGRYAATMPFVGMPGAWRLDVTARRPGRPADLIAIADALRS